MADNKEKSQQSGSSDNGISGATCSGTDVGSDEKQCVKAVSNVNTVKNGSTKVSTKIAHGSLDKRISLTVAPKTFSRDESLFVDRVKYVLGTKNISSNDTSWLFKGSNFYGLLYGALGTTSGLIFPYTPKVSFIHKVNYDKTNIMHSNLSYNYYKNTESPTIKISEAKFTADNRKNALHMLSAIWFLTACTKCEFGEANPVALDAIHADKGLPPPVLYLNGYNSTIDNVPVVITGVSYDYPNDVHYVNLLLDLSRDNINSSDNYEGFCEIYNSETVQNYNETKTVTKEGKIDSSDNYKVTQTKNGINLSFWLPTELSINLDISVQPNFIKTNKQWNLDRYKMGLMLTEKWKNPPIVYGKEQITVNCEEVPKELTLTSIPTGWTW